MNTSQSILQFTRAVADYALPFLTAVAAIGTLTMAIIQAVKESFPARAWFNRPYLHGWLERKATEYAQEAKVETPSADKAHRDLLRLATSGEDEALHDLPIEQLCGQVQAAAQVVLDYPADYSELFCCLAAHAKPGDVAEMLKPVDADGKRTDAQLAARGRVLHHVQRSIDALQIAGGFKWTTLLQWISFGLSYTLTVVALVYYYGSASVATLAKIIVVGVAAGVLAPTARDLVAALEKLRK
jgi:hypothetical protein